MDKAALLNVIKTRLRERGLSAAEASSRAVGNDFFIANMGRERYGMPTFDKLEALANVLDLELYFGPKRDVSPVSMLDTANEEFARITVYEAKLAAGDGSLNNVEHVSGQMAFRRDWLRRLGVAPSQAVLARVADGEMGESMVPTLHPGDMVLIDTSQRAVPDRGSDYRSRKAPLFALRSDNGARIKRIAKLDTSFIALLSDNPDYPPEFVHENKLDGHEIIGRVVWWGHTNKD